MTEHIAFRASGWVLDKCNALSKPAHRAAFDSNDRARRETREQSFELTKSLGLQTVGTLQGRGSYNE
jgi:hypothetical protein